MIAAVSVNAARWCRNAMSALVISASSVKGECRLV
jgi:hypothetical protein